MKSYQVGVIGLGVMGANLALNLLDKGFGVAVFNRAHQGRPSAVKKFMQECVGKDAFGSEDIAEFTAALETPRKIILMVKAGTAVDDVVESLIPHLEKGDIIIDGGNSDWRDTTRRVVELEKRGLLFVGSGISGGAEGARHGPSIMAGGNPLAWTKIRPILQSAAAKCPDGTSCAKWFGEGGVGHFVKMVHNGIEYADMQLISEAYQILKVRNGLSNEEIAKFFEECNMSELGSYLVEITSQILKVTDDSGAYVVDEILDTAGQKGTGKWTVGAALDVGSALPTIAAAVFERMLSASVESRRAASAVFPKSGKTDSGESTEAVRCALLASKIIVYSQGFELLAKASDEFGWNLDCAAVARVWRAGCIIRSVMLDKIAKAYENEKRRNFIYDPYFIDVVKKSILGLRKVCSGAALTGIASPCFTSALSYFDSSTSAQSPANLLQAQRDFFGSHTYEKVSAPRGQFFHTDWEAAIAKRKSEAQLRRHQS